MAVSLSAMFDAVSWPHESLVSAHEDGVTEAWIAELVCAILKAKGGNPSVLETGGFRGITSAWLGLTLQQMGGGTLNVAEIDPERALGIRSRLGALLLSQVDWEVHATDVMQLIHALPDRSVDLAFVDDDHHALHVEQEVVALWPKMAPGGIMSFHDVHGSCNLQTVVKKYGGVALDLPRLGPAGGLGILQVP